MSDLSCIKEDFSCIRQDFAQMWGTFPYMANMRKLGIVTGLLLSLNLLIPSAGARTVADNMTVQILPKDLIEQSDGNWLVSATFATVYKESFGPGGYISVSYNVRDSQGSLRYEYQWREWKSGLEDETFTLPKGTKSFRFFGSYRGLPPLQLTRWVERLYAA